MQVETQPVATTTATPTKRKRARASRKSAAAAASSSNGGVARKPKRQKRNDMKVPPHSRPDTASSLAEARVIFEEARKHTWLEVGKKANKPENLDPEARAKFGQEDTFLQEFRALCEYVLVVAAREIFGTEPVPHLTKSQAERIQRPFRLYELERFYMPSDGADNNGDASSDGAGAGDSTNKASKKPRKPCWILDEIRRDDIGVASTLVDRQAMSSKDPIKAARGLSRLKDPVYLRPLSDRLCLTVGWAVQNYVVFDKSGKVYPNDPRAKVAAVVPISRQLDYQLHPTTIDETNRLHPITKAPRKCCVTNREFKVGDQVLFFRLVIPVRAQSRPLCTVYDRWLNDKHMYHADNNTDTENNNGVDTAKSDVSLYRVVFALDHAELQQRYQEVGQPFGNSKKSSTRRVSRLARMILDFARAEPWILKKIFPRIRTSMLSEEGIMSHDVLEKQRCSASGASGAPVPKKNKPDKVEERIKAWLDFAFSPQGIRDMLELFEEFKMLQISFLKAYKLLKPLVVVS